MFGPSVAAQIQNCIWKMWPPCFEILATGLPDSTSEIASPALSAGRHVMMQDSWSAATYGKCVVENFYGKQNHIPWRGTSKIAWTISETSFLCRETRLLLAFSSVYCCTDIIAVSTILWNSFLLSSTSWPLKFDFRCDIDLEINLTSNCSAGKLVNVAHNITVLQWFQDVFKTVGT